MQKDWKIRKKLKIQKNWKNWKIRKILKNSKKLKYSEKQLKKFEKIWKIRKYLKNSKKLEIGIAAFIWTNSTTWRIIVAPLASLATLLKILNEPGDDLQS